ncbi:MAG: ATP-dependent DNA ligase [Nanoarchaeota archaeon]|nr:ATP-dependent DNA ligase [Nanoarchaeota archaeon]
MEYAKLVSVYTALESTTKRLAKTRTLADFLRDVPESDVASVVLLLQGKVFPNWDDRKVGIASRLVLKALHTATGVAAATIEDTWKETGDLGLAAEQLMGKKKQATLFSSSLSVEKVFTNLQKLASMEGQGTVTRKVQLVAELLTSATNLEARYIIRTVLEDLRVGVGEGSLRDSIAWAYFGKELNLSYDEEKNDIVIDDREEYVKAVDAVQGAYDLTNDFGKVAREAKKNGLKGLNALSVTVFTPLKCMLALKVADIEEGFERCGKPVACENKLDGFRMQIHKDGDEVKLFTRRLDEVTRQFPDVVAHVKSHINAKQVILDAEAVGFDVSTGKYLPFQSIGQRIRRKYDIKKMASEYPVEVNVFDILYHDGKTLLSHPFSERRELLEKVVKGEERKVVVVPSIVSSSKTEISAFYKKSLAAGNEGAMFKKLDAPYKPGARVGHMCKLKDEQDALDLVIVGAEWGEGKRSTWLSSFTLACSDSSGFFEVGKVGTGIKEKPEEGLSFGEMTDELKPLIISERGKSVVIKPKIVVEIAYEEIQKSPTYSSGYALRFPRVKRLRSMERSAMDITTLAEIERLYRKQKKS